MDKESFSFVIYMIHACANKWGKFPSEVYALLTKADCINKYLVPHFDILHTQSTNYIIDDIVEYLGVRGIKI
ncbi:MAG: DUF3791 domain-containing protein [Butyrivibrio sp.]|uniref:DUF3791 domain-containing protein n=1 Tax=Butyrivibrio sp. TaxID=28121 RepID=UPI0025D2305E|nr:DUF3791 domain-containing protein [Butyrivibrio sp.]MCR5770300.1 DUF3791 domain-containing protein [Butyrivibrio sp.]